MLGFDAHLLELIGEGRAVGQLDEGEQRRLVVVDPVCRDMQDFALGQSGIQAPGGCLAGDKGPAARPLSAHCPHLGLCAWDPRS